MAAASGCSDSIAARTLSQSIRASSRASLLPVGTNTNDEGGIGAGRAMEADDDSYETCRWIQLVTRRGYGTVTEERRVAGRAVCHAPVPSS